MSKLRELKPEELTVRCSDDDLCFQHTGILPPLDRTVGQERAMRALEVGLEMDLPGFHIFIAGRTGTGRTSIVRTLVEKEAAQKPIPPDWIYLYDFNSPDRPLAISLQAGSGNSFAQAINQLVTSAQVELCKLFESPLYRERRDALELETNKQKQELITALQKDTLVLGFSLEFTPQGILTIPTRDGKKLAPEEYEGLSDDSKEVFQQNGPKVRDLLEESMLSSRQIDRNLTEKILQLEQEMAAALLTPIFARVDNEYGGHQDLARWLAEMKGDMVSRLDDFKEKEEVPLPLGKPTTDFGRYKVNVFVDHSGQQGAPVVHESNPSYYNLMGKVEYRPAFGTWTTDQTMIKAGALEQANGGYLIVPALELFTSPFSWEALKRALRSHQARVENLSEFIGSVPTTTLRPEPIPIDLKVIVIGQPEHYYVLYAADEDFRKLFKIRADFDLEMARNSQTINDYASFLHQLGEETSSLAPFQPSAVARLIEYGSRLVESKIKLSTRFMEISDIAMESSFWAKKAGREQVGAEHVQKALEEKAYRSRLIEDKIQEMMEKGTVLIEVSGKRVGQINGLSILSIGGYAFGRPNRITARVYIGKEGVVNIEREIALSGPIHSKGVLTLAGYLGGTFAQDFPLTLSASLTFEQSYEGVEGDSASSAELYALLSALAELPISQEIAVTGSVNQYGEIQPIGGVNEKVEGHYAVCKAKGLTGDQGVMIPVQNVENLVLKDEVVQAVAKGEFHVWAVRSIDEGIELLSGVPAGKREENGQFTPDSVHARVYARLRYFARQMKEFTGHTAI